MTPARKRLRALLNYQEGRTQGWIASRIGVTQQTVSALLAGDGSPSLELALAIERVFGIPAREWLPSRKLTRIEGLQPFAEAA